MPKKAVTKPDTSIEQEILKACNEDLDLALFYVAWLKNDMNATKAYKETHPNVSDHSARVLGSKWLARISKLTVLQAYDLDITAYFQQLKAGLNATKWNDFTGEREEDHVARRPYHDKLGRLLGVEQERGGLMQQINVGTEKGNTITFVNFKHEPERQ